MNIKEAKDQIRNAMKAYFTRDERYGYEIPIEKQRPVFLMGPPGIGKTAIMEQIASEMGVGLVSYSMTHHTRQSALGLPFIVHKVYNGVPYDVSEYTMSEIISTVYDMMENTGIQEGILFLDEINCVSETLAPIMLQFLQYKVFGRHRVPDGWIVVTAGNPPEYNNSVREFDIVTWDRLKRIDVEPDFDAWKEYAYKAGVHASIITYLEVRKADFYRIESTVDGKSFVTARGWEDLSQMIRLYEKHGITIDEKLIGQYIQNRKIARSFAIYYDLFNKYRSDYQVDKILSGKAPDEVKKRAAAARFDERLALLGLILDSINEKLKRTVQDMEIVQSLLGMLREFRLAIVGSSMNPNDVMRGSIEKERQALEKGKKAGSLSVEQQHQKLDLISAMEDMNQVMIGSQDRTEAFNRVREDFNRRLKKAERMGTTGRKQLGNIYRFCEEVFQEGQEVTILTTELTVNYYSARFVSRFGCPEYYAHNRDLLLYERHQEIITELESMELDEL